MTPPRILAVTLGEPFGPFTWSGSTAALLRALDARGALAGAVDGSWQLVDRAAKAAAFSPDRELWRQRAHAWATPAARPAHALLARRAAARAGAVDPHPDALLQFGAYHDLAGRLAPRLRCSYHDSNLARYLERPGLRLDPRSRAVRKALDHERRVYDRLDLIMTMSDWLRDSFVEQFGQDPDKVVAVGAGPNLPRIPDAPERDFSRPRFLFVGKLFELKGGPQVLAAFRRVRAERADAELWLVGPTEPPPEQDGVRFFGRIPRDTPEGEARLDRLYREATAFVMPSVYDAFGIVFLEAMAYRLPCVAADRCAMPEIVRHGETGFVVSSDPDELAGRLLELARDRERARAMGQAGYERLVARYTWDGVADRIVDAVAARLSATSS